MAHNSWKGLHLHHHDCPHAVNIPGRPSRCAVRHQAGAAQGRRPQRTSRASQAKPSGISTWINTRPPELASRRHVHHPYGVTNQALIRRACARPPAGPRGAGPGNDFLASAVRMEARKHAEYDAICAATGTPFQLFALETTGGHVRRFLLFTRHMARARARPGPVCGRSRE